MKLSDMLEQKHIIVSLKADNKTMLIEELAGVIADTSSHLDRDSLTRVLLERERLGSTGIGDGVAIPHGKFAGIDSPVISFGRSSKGIDFEAIDAQPVYLFFLLVAPEDSASVHLKALAKVAKILKNNSLKKALLAARTKEEIYQLIIQDDEEF